MESSIIVAIITGSVTLIGSLISAWALHSKTMYRLKQLELKMEKHNNFIERVYILEKDDAVQKEQLKVANHRIDDLEKEVHST